MAQCERRRPLIPALGRQRQVNLCEFEANLVYRVSSRTARSVTHRNPVSKNQKRKKIFIKDLTCDQTSSAWTAVGPFSLAASRTEVAW